MCVMYTKLSMHKAEYVFNETTAISLSAPRMTTLLIILTPLHSGFLRAKEYNCPHSILKFMHINTHRVGTYSPNVKIQMSPTRRDALCSMAAITMGGLNYNLTLCALHSFCLQRQPTNFICSTGGSLQITASDDTRVIG